MKTIKTFKSTSRSLHLYPWVLVFFILFTACKEDNLPNPEKGPNSDDGKLEVKIETEDGSGNFVLDTKGVVEEIIVAGKKHTISLKEGTYKMELKGLGHDYEVEGENPRIVEILSKKKLKILFKILKKKHCHTKEQIVFSSDRTGLGELFAMNTDGSNVRQLTHFHSSTGFPSQPEVSPDGTKVVFTISGNIYTMDIDGTNLEQLTFNPEPTLENRDNSPSWSKDGSKIVFSRLVDGDMSIHIMNADGSGVMRISDWGADSVFQPNLSPDGSKVIFVRDMSLSPEGAKIYIVNSDGTNEHLLIDHQFLNYVPKWSPDGSQILFISGTETSFRQLYVANADGTGVVQLSIDANHKSNPNWSSDGTKMVFSKSPGSGIQNIYFMDADGSDVTQLTDNLFRDSYPSWAPVPATSSLP